MSKQAQETSFDAIFDYAKSIADQASAGVVARGLSPFAATTSAELAAVISDETGSGSLVFATSPTLVTPTLGAATATSINNVGITNPGAGATLTIADGATLQADENVVVAGKKNFTLAFLMMGG